MQKEVIKMSQEPMKYYNSFPYYNQKEDRWGMYGPSSIAVAGCGPTSMAMIMKSYGCDVDPQVVADYSQSHGFHGNGTSGGLYSSIGQKYGLTVDELGCNMSSMTNAIKSGMPCIFSANGNGSFSSSGSGHVLTIVGLTSDGYYLVNDPASEARTQDKHSYDKIKNAMQLGFYAVSKSGQGSIGKNVSNTPLPPATGTIQGVRYGQSAEQVFNSSGYSKYASLFERWGKEYNIDPNLLAALGMQESGLTDISSGPAWGVMQIENTLLDANEGWPNGWLSFGAYGRKYGSAWTSDDRLDGAKNIEYAAYVLNQGFVHYGGDILKTVQQYNYSHYTVDALVATYGDNWFTSGRASKKGYGDGQYVEHVFRYWRPNSLDGRYNNSGSNTMVNGSSSMPITTSVIKSVVGGTGAVRTNPMQDKNTLGGGVELYIVNHDNTVFYPVCSGETVLTYERKDVPTKLEFTVVKTPELDFKEGAQVVFKKNDINMFYGYVFEKSRNKGSTIKVVAYDQLRYFKNKDCYVYENLNLAELLKMIANDYNLTCGNLPDTGYKIPLRVEDNVTIFDILENAIDETLLNTGELYVIYDDFGELKVCNIKDWITDFVVDKETACDIDYKTSINDTSTRIKLYYDNGNTGEREIYINNNEEKINEWGVLQHCEKIEDGEDGVKKAEILSQLHCKKIRTLNIQNVFGNPHIRAGCMVCVILDLGDVMQQNFMLCETVKHKVSNGKHIMDLSLKGGVFQD